MKTLTLLLCIFAAALSGCSKPTHNKPAPAAVTTNTPTAKESGANLNLQWTLNKKYLLRIETVQSWEEKDPQPKKSPKQTLSMAQDYAISALKELPAGGRNLEWEFVAQKFQYQLGSATLLSFDSTLDASHDKGNIAAPPLRKLIGERIRCQIDNEGNILKLDGFKEAHDRMSQGNPELRSTIQSVFSENNFRQLAGFEKIMHPGQPQKPGDQWPATLEVPDTADTMIFSLTCTFKDWELYEGHQCARIEFSGSIISRPLDPATPTTIEDGNMSGRILFDPTISMLITSAGEMHMVLKAKEPKAAATQFHVTTNVRLVKVTER